MAPCNPHVQGVSLPGKNSQPHNLKVEELPDLGKVTKCRIEVGRPLLLFQEVPPRVMKAVRVG